MGNQVEGLLLHRAAFNGIDGSGLCPGEFLHTLLEQGQQGGLASADRAHEQQ
ncbi:hypothetical protein D3C81_2032140 [compost metagenome]